MINFMIIDDERLVTAGIVKLLKSEGYDAVTFNTVDDAMTFVLRGGNADIVISDINMPGMNGLSLCSEIKQHLPVEIIIISGYQSFDYAKKSIDLGAFKYILKPINQREFVSVVKDAVKKVEEKRENAARELQMRELIISKYIMDVANGTNPVGNEMEASILGSLPDPSQLSVLAVELPMLFSSSESGFKYLDDLMKAKCASLPGASVVNICEFQRSRYIVILKAAVHDALIAANLTGRQFFKDYCIAMPIAIGSPLSRNEELGRGIDSAISALHFGYMSLNENWPVVYDSSMDEIHVSSGFSLSRLYYYVSAIIEIISQMDDISALEQIVSELFEEFTRLNFCFDLMKKDSLYIFTCIVYECKKLFLPREMPDEEPLVSRIYAAPAAISLQSSVLDGAKRLYGYVNERIAYGGDIERSIDKLLKTQCGSITLLSAAEQLGISPSYLSVLFKNRTGANFKDYVFSYKMNYAKEMLETTGMKISAIAEKVGYLDADYFTRLFKKRFGKAPSDMRTGKPGE